MGTAGTLAATIQEALRLVDVQRAAGMSESELATFLELTVRTAWPVGRPWIYICQHCHDCGLRMQTCPGDATCGRSKRHAPHEFGEPCWCGVGNRFRLKPKTDDDFTQATKQPKKPVRFGR